METGTPSTVGTRDEATPRLPKTARALPLILLIGFGSIGVALGLMRFGNRSGALTR